MGATILMATCSAFAQLGPDDHHLVAALQARGHRVAPAVWDDPHVDWRGADAVLIRSCWDYYLKLPAFTRWLSSLSAAHVRVFNPPDLIAWNADKRYLLELERAGAPIIPTALIERGQDAAMMETICEQRGWSEVVIKPVVSANAYETRRGVCDAAMQAALAQLLTRSDALLQPFMPQINEGGEWSLICFDGAFSHAVIKRPAAGDFRVQEVWGGGATPAAPPRWLIERAEAAAAAAPGGAPLYARIDGVVVNEQFLLMELEAIEPELFLRFGAPDAAQRLARALEARL